MKKFIPCFLALYVLMISGAHGQKYTVPPGGFYCSQKKSAMTYRPVLYKEIQSGPTHSFDVLDYSLDLNLYHCYSNPFPHDFTGSVTIKFRVDSTLNSIQLNAKNLSLTIQGVSLAGISHTHTNDILTIQLNRTYIPGEIASVKIKYMHNDVTDNAFYVSNGMVFTDCEPEGARAWFPCWDRPSDKATVELKAKVPNTVKLGSNGALMDSTHNGDTLTYRWKSIHDVATYLVVISSKVNYHLDQILWQKPGTPPEYIPFRFYYNDGEDPSFIISIMRDMTDWFSDHFCVHPFQKNGFAALNNSFPWGGMENQTLTSICPNCWDESLAAHEFAHQWYGDMITCATWADIWLNEGFATWSEAFWRERDGGYDEYKWDIDGYASVYLGNNPGWAISDPSWATVTPGNWILFNYSITYCKGASVLHMLRYTLGDSLFFATLQAYCADTTLKFKSAVIPDFNGWVNSVTGTDYDWFFNQWIYEPNHPNYQNFYDFEELGANQWKVNFYTTQVQTDPPFFQMPIELKIRFSDNTDTVVRVMNDQNYQRFAWTVGKQPVAFFFDPDSEIVLKNSSTVLGIPGQQVVPGSMHLSQNFPNPSGRSTRIVYELGEEMNITLSLSDPAGRILMTPVSGTRSSGKHFLDLDCTGLAPGMYYYRLSSGNKSITKKMIITSE